MELIREIPDTSLAPQFDGEPMVQSFLVAGGAGRVWITTAEALTVPGFGRPWVRRAGWSSCSRRWAHARSSGRCPTGCACARPPAQPCRWPLSSVVQSAWHRWAPCWARGAVGSEQQAPREGAVVGSIARGSGGSVTGLLALATGCRETVKLRATETVGDRARISVDCGPSRTPSRGRVGACVGELVASRPAEPSHQRTYPPRARRCHRRETITDDRVGPRVSLSSP